MVLGDTLDRVRSNWRNGRLDTGIDGVVTGLSSVDFADLPEVVAPDHLVLVLDHGEVDGVPEIVWVTAHVLNASAVTVVRGQEGTVARAHAEQTTWLHAMTAFDLDDTGDLIVDVSVNAEAHYGDVAAHHSRYENSEAVAAMGGVGDANPLNHARYDDGEAVSAMGGLGDTNPLNHARYTDANARAAVSNIYLPLTGGQVSGHLELEGTAFLDGSVILRGSAGIEYQGTSHGGGSANKIGFKWGGIQPNHVNVVVDNVVAYAIANFDDLADYLPLTGGSISGNLVVAQTFYVNDVEISGHALRSGTEDWDVSGLKNIMITDSMSAPSGGTWGDVVMNYGNNAAVKGLWILSQYEGWERIAAI